MKIRLIAIAAASALACSVSLTPTAQAGSAGLDYFIDSPYAGVDWNWTQYKSGFHAFGITIDEKSVKTNKGRSLSDAQAAVVALEAVDRTTADVHVDRDFGGKAKAFTVTITTADGVSVVSIDAESGEVLAIS